jgi:hypothetical protein
MFVPEAPDDLDWLPALGRERAAWVGNLSDRLEQPYRIRQMLDPRGGIYGGRDNDGHA